MPERTQTTRKVERKKEKAGSTETKESKEQLVDDIDAVLDEIDAVLEENANEVVWSYRQKGGQ